LIGHPLQTDHANKMSWPNCARRQAKFRLYAIIGRQLLQLPGGDEDCAVGAAGESANVSQNILALHSMRKRLRLSRGFSLCACFQKLQKQGSSPTKQEWLLSESEQLTTPVT
jgi:hypothetical protein